MTLCSTTSVDKDIFRGKSIGSKKKTLGCFIKLSSCSIFPMFLMIIFLSMPHPSTASAWTSERYQTTAEEMLWDEFPGSARSKEIKKQQLVNQMHSSTDMTTRDRRLRFIGKGKRYKNGLQRRVLSSKKSSKKESDSYYYSYYYYSGYSVKGSKGKGSSSYSSGKGGMFAPVLYKSITSVSIFTSIDENLDGMDNDENMDGDDGDEDEGNDDANNQDNQTMDLFAFLQYYSNTPSTSPPTQTPTAETSSPTLTPTTSAPSLAPSSPPTLTPTTSVPSLAPSRTSTQIPSTTPTEIPSLAPSSTPSRIPSTAPTESISPSLSPSSAPTRNPTQGPSSAPTESFAPSSTPSSPPTPKPTRTPTLVPPTTRFPTRMPTPEPTTIPLTAAPSSTPTVEPIVFGTSAIKIKSQMFDSETESHDEIGQASRGRQNDPEDIYFIGDHH